MTKTQEDIIIMCANLAEHLIRKNIKYSNSALSPTRIFSKEENNSNIENRLDEKLERINSSDELRPDDVQDVAGYIILLCIKKGWFKFEASEALYENPMKSEFIKSSLIEFFNTQFFSANKEVE